MQAAEKMPDLIQKAIQLETEEQFDACDALFQKIIEAEPQNAEAFMRYGQFLSRTKSFEKARDMLNKGLELHPQAPLTWFYLAVVYDHLERPDNVDICFKNALALEPNNERYLKGFVNFLFKEGRLDEAQGSIEKIIESTEEGDETSSYMLGLSVWNAGDMKAASNYFKKAALMNKDNIQAISACMKCLFYLENFEEFESFTTEILAHQGLNPFYRSLIKMMKYIVIFSLNPSMNLRDRVNALRIPRYDPSEDLHLNQLNFNMWAYREMIQHFYIERSKGGLDYAEGFMQKPEKAIYFIGESHAFEPLHLNLNIAGEKHRVAAKLLMGIKAFHLASKKRNQMKTIFEERCKQLPQNPMVGISIGEIDCRPTEGFAPYFIRNPDINQQEHMHKILTQFVDYVEQTLAPKNPQKIYITGVPAPSLSYKTEVDDNDRMRIKVIALYNKVLQEICAKRPKVEVLDFYNITVNAEGRSDDKWHIADNVHLKPAAYVEAFKLIAL